MNKFWSKKSQDEIKTIVFNALEKNIDYQNEFALGVPASYLDDKVFYQDASFVNDAPFMSVLLHNPNHIGCHTIGKSEPFFQGTQNIERELINICAVDILKAEHNQYDGYVASGGTEANIQAIWVYRNFFINQINAAPHEICIICSEDSHYSIDKSANLLGLDLYKISVDQPNREMNEMNIHKILEKAKRDGKSYFIVVCNMMTTMFGSVDNIEVLTAQLEAHACRYKLHVDGAYGGFYYPFTSESDQLSFQNHKISSFTLDAHKMAQAPYGTGIFLIRKGLIQHVCTKEAKYVEGEDYTLIGSRSGANAVAAWMILVKNGPFGWHEKVFILQKRTEWMCEQLNQKGISFYRNKFANIITVKSKYISQKIALKYGLVADDHHDPKWYKIVIMDHVTIEKLMSLMDEINHNI